MNEYYTAVPGWLCIRRLIHLGAIQIRYLIYLSIYLTFFNLPRPAATATAATATA